MSWRESFNLFDGVVILRLSCALHFIPHVLGKFVPPTPLPFFTAAGFKPPAAWMYLAAIFEVVLITLLFFDILTPYAALGAALHLLVAGVATYKVTRKWLWVIGGAEYCVFWMLTCIALAMLTWPR